MKKLLSPFKTGVHLYVIGAVIILLGCSLVIPTMARVEHFWQDPLFFLGAPIVTNGITVIVFGIIMLAFGQLFAKSNIGNTRLVPNAQRRRQNSREMPKMRSTITCAQGKTRYPQLSKMR